MDTLSEVFWTATPGGLDTPEGWLGELARYGHAPQADSALASLSQLEVDNLVEDLVDLLRWRLPLEAPESFEQQASWLRWLDGLDQARRGAQALAERLPWAAALARQLEEALLARQQHVEQMAGGWWHSRTADAELAEGGRPDARPWCWVRSLRARGGLASVAADQQIEVVRAWAAGALIREDEQALRAAVETEPAWRQVYQGWLHGRLGEVWIERGDLSLELRPGAPLLRMPLPHLGRGKFLNVTLTDDGSRWELPGHALLLPRGSSSIVLPLGTPVGEVTVSVQEQPLDEEQQADRVLQSSKLLVDSGVPDEQALAVAVRLAAWCTGRIPHLEAAAQAFRENEEGDDFWPRRLVEVRAHLGRAERVLAHPAALGAGVAPLRQALEQFDRQASPHCESTLVLEDEFLESLSDALGPFPPGAWWVPVREPSLLQLERLKPSAEGATRTRLARFSVPRPVQAAALGHDATVPQERLLQWRSDDGWEAEMNLPLVASEGTKLEVRFFELPEGAAACLLAGLELPIERPEAGLPLASCTLGQLFEADQNDPHGLTRLQIRIGDSLSMAVFVEEE